MRRLFIVPLLLLAHSAMSQQDQFLWRLGAHAGITRSLADIESSYKDVNWDRSRAFGLELSRSLGYGISLGLGYENARVSGYDMLTGRKDRALNFMSELNTAQLELSFRSDNGKLLKYNARFAPFITIGVGVGQYDVFGDLYSASGSRYYYWNDGSIRDQAEGGINAGDAVVIEQNGDFETRLTDLATEDDKPKDQLFMFIPARIGLKWRISDRLAAELYYGFNWTFTDGIDDVYDAYAARPATNELAYASNPTGRTGERGDPGTNDKYQSIGLNLAYYFGRRSNSYRMEPIYVDDRSLPLPPPPPAPVKKLPLPLLPPVPPAPTTVVINVERITVGSLTVDSLVVGTLITRQPTIPDTAAEYSIRRSKLDSILSVEAGLDTTQMDSLQASKVDSMKMISPDSILLGGAGRDTIRMDSLRSSEVDSLEMFVPDSLRSHKAGLDTIRMDSLRSSEVDSLEMLAPDSLRSGLAVQTVVPSSDTIRTAAMDTVQTRTSDTLVAPPGASEQRRTLEELEPDSIAPVLQDTLDSVPMDTAKVGGVIRGARQYPQDSVVDGQTTRVIQDTVMVYQEQGDSLGRVDTVYVDRPVPSARSEQTTPASTQQPQQVVIREESSGGKDTRTVPVPIVIPSTRTEVVQDPALQDSLRGLEAENERLRNMADSLRGDTSALGVYKRSPVDTTPAPPGVKPEDYAFIINDLMAARIATLERYIEVMDDQGSTAKADSLKQRIAVMDKELAEVREEGRTSKDSAAKGPKMEMGQTLMDSISFSSESSRVGSVERAHLLKMGKQIASRKVERVLVTGQTDRSGDPAFNLQLSQKRADAVKQVLVEAGVPVGIISAKGLGDKLAQHTHNESERVVVVQVVMPAKKTQE